MKTEKYKGYKIEVSKAFYNSYIKRITIKNRDKEIYSQQHRAGPTMAIEIAKELIDKKEG